MNETILLLLLADDIVLASLVYSLIDMLPKYKSEGRLIYKSENPDNPQWIES